MSALRRLFPPAAALALLATAVAYKPWLHAHLLHVVGPVLSDGFDTVVASAAWLVAAWGGSRIVDALATGTAERPARIPRLLSDLLRFFLYGFAVLAILAFVLDQPVTGLLATSGVAIAVLGFALRNMIADIFAGIALNIEHPYRIGDWIELSPGVAGRVDEINWRATRLITTEGTAIIVPNGIVAGSRFTNVSRPTPAFRVAVPVLLDQEVPVERAKRVLLSGLMCADGVLASPRPDVVVVEATANGVAYQARFWMEDGARVAIVRDGVLTAILGNLARAGIELAHQKREFRPRRSATNPPGTLRRRLLQQLDLFAAFDEAEIAELALALRKRRIPAGTAAVRQGEPGQSLFVIAEGVFDVQLDQGAVPVRLNRLSPGDLFGEMSLLTGQPRSASVIAGTDAVVYELDKDHVDPVLRRRPELARLLAELMAQRQTRNEEERVRQGRAGAAPPPVASQDLLARLRGFFKL